MTPERFCDWLQGYVELDGETPSPEQWEMIKEHLGLVYNKTTSTKEELTQKKEKATEFTSKKSNLFCSGGGRVIC